MSGLAHPSIYGFRKILRARGAGMEGLARDIGVTRHYLSQLLWGHFPKNKGNHWARIRACVTEQEWGLLSRLPHVSAWLQVARKEAEPYYVRWVCGQCGTGLGFRAAGAETPVSMTMSGICPVCFGLRKEKCESSAPTERAPPSISNKTSRLRTK